jgi:sec-independent protein translocase protein TatC
MKATRPYAIVVIFLLAAVITPTPDIFTLVLMGAPMVLLYEACIWIARWME